MKAKSLSRVRLFSTPWTVAYQAPRSMGFSRQEYWSGLPFPSPGDLPNPGIEPGSPALQTDTLLSEPSKQREDSNGAGPMVLAPQLASPPTPAPSCCHPPCPLPAFCLWKKFNQKISLTREVRNAEAKENSQRRLNSNNVVIKHSQGSLILSFSRAIDNILSHIL